MQSRIHANVVLFLTVGWLGADLTACVGPPGPKQSATQESVAIPHAETGPQAECLPNFPDHDGWYGADAAYSVPLPIEDDRTSLWLFGDTFVQRPGSRHGRAYPFIHNSIGISVCRPGGEWQLETFWQREPGAQPLAFFVPAPESTWVREAKRTSGHRPYYWPFDGFIAHDTLFVGLLRVVESPPRGPFSLPFRLVGMDLARIENYRDAPKDWRIQLSTLSTNTTAFPASAFVESGSYVYAFSFFDHDGDPVLDDADGGGGGGDSHRILSRLDLASLVEWQADLTGSLATWTKDQAWRDGFTPDRAMIVMDDGSSEMSVHFDAEHERWLAVYVDPARDRGDDGPGILRWRRADKLAGPWSSPEPLLQIPETSSGDYGDDLFCYAGKAHPQFSSPNALVVTYVCNLFAKDSSAVSSTLQQLLESPSIYRPRAIAVENPRDLEAQKTE